MGSRCGLIEHAPGSSATTKTQERPEKGSIPATCQADLAVAGIFGFRAAASLRVARGSCLPGASQIPPCMRRTIGAQYGRPEIFNTDQGCQFTSQEFTDVLKQSRASGSAPIRHGVGVAPSLLGLSRAYAAVRFGDGRGRVGAWHDVRLPCGWGRLGFYPQLCGAGTGVAGLADSTCAPPVEPMACLLELVLPTHRHYTIREESSVKARLHPFLG